MDMFKSTKFREARASSLRLGQSFQHLPENIQSRIVKSEIKLVVKDGS